MSLESFYSYLISAKCDATEEFSSRSVTITDEKANEKASEKEKKTSWEKMRKILNFFEFSDPIGSRTYEQN